MRLDHRIIIEGEYCTVILTVQGFVWILCYPGDFDFCLKNMWKKYFDLLSLLERTFFWHIKVQMPTWHKFLDIYLPVYV
jgi:hypothetical protein